MHPQTNAGDFEHDAGDADKCLLKSEGREVEFLANIDESTNLLVIHYSYNSTKLQASSNPNLGLDSFMSHNGNPRAFSEIFRQGA